jgi:uncharacterized protein YcbK (DUF882 family)
MIAAPAILRASERERQVALLNLHTGEALRTIFWADGRLLPQALDEINVVLRDHRSGDVSDIDPQLLEQLHRLAALTGTREPFHVISGYRSPKTNAMLRKKTGGVAKKSYHMKGQAIDIRLPRVPLRSLQQAALSLQSGGVGYYGKSDFIHIDTGPVRRWG